MRFRKPTLLTLNKVLWRLPLVKHLQVMRVQDHVTLVNENGQLVRELSNTKSQLRAREDQITALTNAVQLSPKNLPPLWYCPKCNAETAVRRAGVVNVCAGCMGPIFLLTNFDEVKRYYFELFQLRETRTNIAAERDRLHDRVRELLADLKKADAGVALSDIERQSYETQIAELNQQIAGFMRIMEGKPVGLLRR